MHTHSAYSCAHVHVQSIHLAIYTYINTLTCTQTWLLHLLTQSRSHSIQSLLTHQSSQDCLRFQGVLWANSNHIEGNTILLFAYCPNSHPKAQSKNAERGNTKKFLWNYNFVLVCVLIFHLYVIIYIFLLFTLIVCFLPFDPCVSLSGVSQGISWGIFQAMLSKVSTTSKFCK